MSKIPLPQLTKRLFDFLFTRSPVGIYLLQHGTFQLVNASFEVLTGYKAEELLRMAPSNLILPEDRKEAGKNALRMLRGERRLPYGFRLITKGGEIRQVMESVTFVLYRGQRAVLGYLMDVTKRKLLEGELRRSIQRLYRTLTGTVVLLSKLLRLKDPYTAVHQERVAHLSAAMAQEMGFSPHRVRGIHVAALVHDIGKLCIPSEVLCKPGGLSGPEFAILKEHPRVGYELLRNLDFPWPVAEIVLQHHERLDGSGYPLGLKGDQILPEARILAVADVVEAIISHRPYREAKGREKAVEEITRNVGKLYDATAVAACLEVIHKGKVIIGPAGRRPMRGTFLKGPSTPSVEVAS